MQQIGDGEPHVDAAPGKSGLAASACEMAATRRCQSQLGQRSCEFATRAHLVDEGSTFETPCMHEQFFTVKRRRDHN